MTTAQQSPETDAPPAATDPAGVALEALTGSPPDYLVGDRVLVRGAGKEYAAVVAGCRVEALRFPEPCDLFDPSTAQWEYLACGLSAADPKPAWLPASLLSPALALVQWSAKRV